VARATHIPRGRTARPGTTIRVGATIHNAIGNPASRVWAITPRHSSCGAPAGRAARTSASRAPGAVSPCPAPPCPAQDDRQPG
jgi:hypothetical protein